eukprot:350095-Chlamydomonas_euryale.AAC.4
MSPAAWRTTCAMGKGRGAVGGEKMEGTGVHTCHRRPGAPPAQWGRAEGWWEGKKWRGRGPHMLPAA